MRSRTATAAPGGQRRYGKEFDLQHQPPVASGFGICGKQLGLRFEKSVILSCSRFDFCDII